MNQLGNSQSLTEAKNPQRTSASKPGLKLLILCPCLLGNSAVFKILMKTLFKLRWLQKYIRQSHLYLYSHCSLSSNLSSPNQITCISFLLICSRCIPVTPSHLFILVHKYKNNLLQIQLKCINSLEHCCFYITNLVRSLWFWCRKER